MDSETSVGWTIFAVVYVAVFLGSAVVTALKGKWGMTLLGLLVGIVWIVSALRLAKPRSWWARRFYGPEQLEAARRRFG